MPETYRLRTRRSRASDWLVAALCVLLTPSALVARAAQPAAPTQSPNTSVLDATIVNVVDVVVEGASAYSPMNLAPYIEPYRRKAVSLRQLGALAQALTALYRHDGYVISQVILPEQPIRNGIVRLQAQEGYIARVNFEGKAPRKRRALDGAIAALQRARPLTAEALERSLLLINDLAGVSASATLAPHPERPGAAQLNLRFTQRKYGGSVGVSNRASRSLGRLRTEAQVDAYSLLGGFDLTRLAIASSGSAKFNSMALEHERPIGSSGLKAHAKVKALESRPGKRGNRNLETRTREAEVGLSYPVLRSRNKNMYVKGALVAHNGEIDLPALSSKDKTRAARVALGFDSTDRWQGVNSVELALSQGLNVLGASDNGSAQASRARGRSDFTKLTLYAARLQALRDQWSVLGAINGQYAFTDLLVPELFTFGGDQLGRGYDAAELAGDHGAAAKVELRYSGSNPQAALNAYTLYGFWDAGKVWLRSPNSERAEKSSQSAAAAGLGARMNIGPSATTFVELAKPLTREVAQEGNKQARLFAGVNYRF